MELDASLSWLALALTPGLACRLSARLLRKFGSPERVFDAPLTELESCSLPALVARAIFNKDSFKRAEKRARCRPQHRQLPPPQLDRSRDTRKRSCRFYDPPVLFACAAIPISLMCPASAS